MDLVAFLLARIGYDLQVVKWQRELMQTRYPDAEDPGEHWLVQSDRGGFVLLSEERLAADSQARLRVVELHRLGGTYTPGDDLREGFSYCATCGSGEPYEYPTAWPCETLKLLALPYADHPDYRPEWAPTVNVYG
jgi:hypothetical protein